MPFHTPAFGQTTIGAGPGFPTNVVPPGVGVFSPVGSDRRTAESAISKGAALGIIGTAACANLTGNAQAICLVLAQAVTTFAGGDEKKRATQAKMGNTTPLVADSDPCPPGKVSFRNKCVDFSAAAPGGDPFLTEAGGQAVAGGFGLPAYTPLIEQTTVRRCGPRMVLGFDNLCYPKAVLPPRSQFRKWKRPPRTTLSRRDEAAIRRAAGAKDRVLSLAKEAGLFASKTRPQKKVSSRGHQHLIAPPQLRVISEETN